MPGKSDRQLKLDSGQAVLFIAASDIDSSLYYACHFLTSDPIAYTEIEGESFRLFAHATRLGNGIARRSLRGDGLGAAWPAGRVRSMQAPEDVLILADPAEEPSAVSASRLERDDEGRLRLSEVPEDTAGLHGALVVARTDGAVLGFLLVRDDEVRIAPLD